MNTMQYYARQDIQEISEWGVNYNLNSSRWATMNVNHGGFMYQYLNVYNLYEKYKIYKISFSPYFYFAD